MESPSLKQSGHGPRQLAVGDPACTGVLDQETSRDPFQPQPFCASMFWSSSEKKL